MTHSSNGSAPPGNGSDHNGLVQALLHNAVADVRPGLQADPGLAHVLAAMHHAGQQAWPGLALEGASFVRQVARHLKPGMDLRRLDAPGLYLAAACAGGDGKAHGALENVLRPLAARVAARLNRSRVPATELVLAARNRLLQPDGSGAPRIAGFTGVGGLDNWLQAMMTRMALAGRL